MPAGIHRNCLHSSVLIRNKKIIQFKFHIVPWCSSSGENLLDHMLLFSASRPNIYMAASTVIDSWEINSVTPSLFLLHRWQFVGITLNFERRSLWPALLGQCRNICGFIFWVFSLPCATFREISTPIIW